MFEQPLKVIGHRLCPYVQRITIPMLENGIAFEQIEIDLDHKPSWLKDISPSRQVPVVQVGADEWLFESGVIARYLDRTTGTKLLPVDPLSQARHEAWMSFADGMLNIVARIIYRDADAEEVLASMTELADRLDIVSIQFPPDDYFAGEQFGLVDVVFATLFRFFPVLDQVSTVKLKPGMPEKLATWWDLVRHRPSVSSAVPDSFNKELTQFIAAKQSYAGRMLQAK
ncbi:MAG: glutathione S-transferase family protein [Pseudomonadota bacterium]